MNKQDNPPAFPYAMQRSYSCPKCSTTGAYTDEVPGMTLRDYFAAAALTGLLSDMKLRGSKEDFAQHAYEQADAMLERRESDEA